MRRSLGRHACVLHDVGKVPQRGEKGAGKTHQEHGADFVSEYVDDPELEELVRKHHDDPSEASDDLYDDMLVLQCADALSSPERRGEKKKRGEGKRLRSIFPSLDGEDTEVTYPLRPLELSRETIFPKETHGTETISTYRVLWSGFTDEYDELEPDHETLIHLLWKYSWSVPSAYYYDRLDVSLYDHLRTTTAIGDVLYGSDLSTSDLESLYDGVRSYWRYEKNSETPREDFAEEGDDDTVEAMESEDFLLVKGDLSGVQRFLTKVDTPEEAQEGMAKRMRGRSTHLWLLNEGFLDLLLDRLELPYTSRLWSGGGQFYVLVPADEREEVEEFVREANDWLFEKHEGDLFLVSGAVEASALDLYDFPRLLRRADEKVEEEKLSKASDTLSGLDTAVLSEPTEACPICGRDSELEEGRCTECHRQETTGGDMPGSDYLVLARGSDVSEEAHVSIGVDEGVGWRFTDSPDPEGNVYAVNDTEIPRGRNAGFTFAGTRVPYGGSAPRVWSFSEQKALGRGNSGRMHVVKMDLDDLGATLSTGLEGEKTPSRVATLSRSLDQFFSGYVNRVAEDLSFVDPEEVCDGCEETLEEGEVRRVEHRGSGTATYRRPENRDGLHEDCFKRAAVSPVYINYSGGDDMLFVAPWNEALEFGTRLRDDFGEYTSDALSVSAGFHLTRAKSPIGRSMREAEEKLERAKGLRTSHARKDGAYIFGETLHWHDDEYRGVSDLLDLGRRLDELVQEDEISSSMVYSLLELRRKMYPEKAEGDELIPPDEVSLSKEYIWRLKYLLSRNLKGDVLEELDDKLPYVLPWASVPVSWASLSNR